MFIRIVHMGVRTTYACRRRRARDDYIGLVSQNWPTSRGCPRRWQSRLSRAAAAVLGRPRPLSPRPLAWSLGAAFGPAEMAENLALARVHGVSR